MKFKKYIIDEDLTWDEEEFNKDIPLEELLYWDSELNNDYLEEDYGDMPFDTGDIVMSSEDAPVPIHRMYIVDDVIDAKEGPQYTCFVMSSKVDKANVNDHRYPANILIKNYGSIIKKGTAPDKDVIIKIDQPMVLDHADISSTGAKKGIVTDLFKKFIATEYLKHENGLDTSKDYWDNGKPVINKN